MIGPLRSAAARRTLARLAARAAMLLASATVGFAAGTHAPIEKNVPQGPTVISAEERAIVSNPAAGMEHGVILAEEWERDDTFLDFTLYAFHRRAKVLSNEGRAIGNIEIPFDPDDRLDRWWGRTLLPDGTVLELKKDDLARQTLVKGAGNEFLVLKGVLPGVAPGCLVDYGWTVRNNRGRVLRGLERLSLQQPWPIQRLDYRWETWPYISAGYAPRGTKNLGVQFGVFTGIITVSAKELPAFQSEPLMPPEDISRASVTLYYAAKETKKDFWNERAKRMNGRVHEFTRSEKDLQRSLASMAIPESGTVGEKTRAAYAWIEENVADTSLTTAEEIEAAAAEKEPPPDWGREVLAARKGTPLQIDMLFIGIARALGAEAELVFAADRTDHYVDPQIQVFSQFDASLVALREPGAENGAWELVDPGSGLPYGQVPWWLTGIRGTMMSIKGAEEIVIPSPKVGQSVSETSASVTYTEESASASWNVTGSGQVGLGQRRLLRRATPEDRKKEIEEMCASGEAEIRRADAPDLEKRGAPFRLECEADFPQKALAGCGEECAVSFDGPWLPEVVELPSESRKHPVVFSFARIEHQIVRVVAPPGMTAAAVPRPVKLDNPFGRYVLSVKAGPEGYVVDRTFTLLRPFCDSADYPVLRKLITDVKRADRTPLVFRRGAAP